MRTSDDDGRYVGEYVSAQAASDRLGLPINTVYRLIDTGKLPALRFPVRILHDDLDKVLDRCRVLPGALRHLNQYSGRPPTGVADWYRSRRGVRNDRQHVSLEPDV